MDKNVAKMGLEETQNLHHQYEELLRLLGQGNLLHDSSSASDPTTVPEKCENTGKLVEEIINSMKSSLKIIRQSYQCCHDERAQHNNKMLTLDSLLSPNFKDENLSISPQYEALYKKLQNKNADLKVVIDEVRQVFGLINQLPTS